MAPTLGHVIVDCALYRSGVRVPLDGDRLDLVEARSRVEDEGDFVWVGLHDPDAHEMARVAVAFGLHPLAVEDSLRPHQRPKLERYDAMLFLVLRTLWYVDEEDAVETGQVTLFVGGDFVVTVRHGRGVELTSARQSLERQTAVLGHGPSAVVYAVCDRVVDAYESVVAALEEDVVEVEESVFSPQRTRETQRIYVLKRELLECRRAVNPLRAPMEQFAAGGVPGVSPKAAPFFRDVADHVVRVTEAAEALDVLLSSAFEAHMARLGLQQNEDMRKISAWVAIGAACTVVAGVYGMNFERMPELEWRFGYAWALGLMVFSSLLLHRLFKRSGWL